VAKLVSDKMKITEKQLRKIIQETISNIDDDMNEEGYSQNNFSEVGSLNEIQKIIISIQDVLDKKMTKPSPQSSTKQDQVCVDVARFLIKTGNQLIADVKKFSS
jgi:hypothetical protein